MAAAERLGDAATAGGSCDVAPDHRRVVAHFVSAAPLQALATPARPRCRAACRCDGLTVQPWPRRRCNWQDLDCFYAQVEEQRRPELAGRPLGVTQKYLVVTSNYAARRLGVPKMVPITDAKRKCPDLVLINGEDLTPYRAASRRIMDVLRRWGTVERLGLDEAVVDLTAEVAARVRDGSVPAEYCGHVVSTAPAVAADLAPGGDSSARCCPGPGSKEEVAELRDGTPEAPTQDWTARRVVYNAFESSGQEVPAGSRGRSPQQGLSIPRAQQQSAEVEATLRPLGEVELMLGSQVALEVRCALETETGYRCSCGIAHNKMLAKMACGLHKPNAQTSLPATVVASFIAPLPARKVPGVGHHFSRALQDIGVQTILDLQQLSLDHLISIFGPQVGTFMHEASRGLDGTPVRDRGPPKSISVEDSFRGCTSRAIAQTILAMLAPDFIARLDEDREETGRTPRTLTVKWRAKGQAGEKTISGSHSLIRPERFSSISCPMPADVTSRAMPSEGRAEAATSCAVRLLARAFDNSAEFNLAVLNLGATNFVPADGTEASGDGCSIQGYFDKGEDAAAQCMAVISASLQSQLAELQRTSPSCGRHRGKREARAEREERCGTIHSGKASPVVAKGGTGGRASPARTAWHDETLAAESEDDEDDSIWQDRREASYVRQLRRLPPASSLSAATADRHSKPDDSTGFWNHVKSSSPAPDDKSDAAWVCTKCGEQVWDGLQAAQEHQDFHMAARLQANEQGGLDRKPWPLKSSLDGLFDSVATRRAPTAVSSRDLVKRPRRATLDQFFSRHSLS
eukprot:SM000011S18966  [mRNA]  locus=s11:117343:121843:+ [translate_table: standard]